jgi:polyhydroxyalkanoate synthesis repressor PhaR
MIIVKKYGNRRLYDTTRSCYINLEQLADLVRAGHRVQVLDARTGEDLTREVLTQILLEVLKPADVFPTELLRRIIMSTGNLPYQGMLQQQIASGMKLLNSQMEAMERMFGVNHPFAQAPAPPPAGPFEPPPDDDAPEEPPAREPSPVDELAELRRRMADLEKRLSR